MEAIIGPALRLFAFIFPWVVRKLYPIEKVNKKLIVQVNNNGSGLTLQCGELPTSTLWLQIFNQSPFNIKIECVEIHITLGGQIGKFRSVKKIMIRPYSNITFYDFWSLTDSMAEYISRNHENNKQVEILFEADLGARYDKFKINKTINTKNFETMNLRTHNKENRAGTH